LLKEKESPLMNKMICALATLLAFTSCANSYHIIGTSNVTTLDGRMLYLKVLKNNDFKKLDSCDVIHGQFQFAGTVDTTRMASIFMDSESVLPLVLECGDINVKIDNTQQLVSGTPLNDKLFKFFTRYNQLKNEEAELVHRHDEGIMNGRNMNVINARLNEDAACISAQEDRFITDFVCNNFDNILGPGIFFMVTANNKYPMLTPWIEDVMSRATDKFKNDPYVKDYYEKAQENEQIMNGMKQLGSSHRAPFNGLHDPNNPNAAPAPTPAALAQPVSE
jgi:hypothetical protein